MSETNPKAAGSPGEHRNDEQTFAARDEQRAFLRQVLDINPNLIFAKDRDGRFTLVNKALADVYGTTIESLIGKTDADFNPNPEEVAFFRQMDLEVMNSLQERLIPEERVTDAMGQVHYLTTVKRPIVGADGVANQVLGVATDITEHKRLEEQLRQSQKMEALGFLAGGIAHDFNNLLTVIFGNADLMSQRLRNQPQSDPRLLSSVEILIAAARRAESLTRQLLAFSRKQPLHPVALDLNAVVANLSQLLRQLIGEHIRLDVRIHESPLFVNADPGQVEQVIMNLAVNARDALPDGGDITISTTACNLNAIDVIKHPGARTGPHAVLTVQDTGVGIREDILERIFEPFFTTKPVGQGTGLGLSTVYGIVKQGGGHTTVESKPGTGSMFRVFLPVVDPPQNAMDGESTELTDLTGDETVLICEDQRDVLDLAEEILLTNGYTVLVAQNARAALEIAERHAAPIHLLLTDVVMPEMNGRQLADAVRARRTETQILFMTGYSSDFLRADVGADQEPLLAKPFSTHSLLSQVRSLLNRSAGGVGRETG